MKTWLNPDAARRALKEGRGEGIHIAILDSGVETSHGQLKGLKLKDDLALIEQEAKITISPGLGIDAFGHGTAVAGIIHALAPAAQLGSFRVLGEHLRSRTALIAEAARQAIQRGYHILNCSFGCAREDQIFQYKDWIDAAYLKGRHVVAACNNCESTRREWPGHFPTVITVNFAATDDPEAILYRPGTLVEFAARGQDVEVPWIGGGKKRVTGSSFAAPHAAGMLARLLSHFPDAPPLQAKAMLQYLG